MARPKTLNGNERTRYWHEFICKWQMSRSIDLRGYVALSYLFDRQGRRKGRGKKSSVRIVSGKMFYCKGICTITTRFDLGLPISTIGSPSLYRQCCAPFYWKVRSPHLLRVSFATCSNSLFRHFPELSICHISIEFHSLSYLLCA